MHINCLQKYIVIVLFLLLCHSTSRAQWTPTNLEGGTINAFALTDTAVYAGAYGGVYKSTNNGESWISLTFSLPVPLIKAMAVKDSMIFVGGDVSTELYRTTDDGKHWLNISSGLGSNFMRSLFVLDSTVLAGTGLGIYRSTNNGDTWVKADSGMPIVTEAYEFVTVGSIIVAACDRGVYISRDNGISWINRSSGLPWAPFVYTVISFRDTLFIGTHGYGVFFSADTGANWFQVINGMTDSYILSLTSNGTHIFAGTIGGNLFRSSDLGGNWELGKSGLPGTNIRHLVAAGNNILAGTYAKGIYKSSNNGDNWIISNAGLHAQFIRTLTGTEGQLITGGESGVYCTLDNGMNWNDISNGLPESADIYSSTICGNNTIVGTNYLGVIGGMYISSDTGKSWVSANSGLPSSMVMTMLRSGDTVLAGTSGRGVFRSVDNGMNWLQLGSGIITQTFVDAILCFNNTIFVATSGSGVWRSLNNSDTWTQASDGLPVYPDYLTNYLDVLSIESNNNCLLAGTRYGGIYRSTDNGDSWNSSNMGLPLVYGVSCQSIALAGSTIFIGTNYGIYYSTNNGNSWKEANSGLPLVKNVSSLRVDNGYLYAGFFGDGVWKASISELTGVEYDRIGLFYNYKLEQNYPNPFNPTTTITFELKKSSFVVLKVFNVLGQEVTTLVNEKIDAGVHKVKFDGSKLSSGVFLYRMQTESFVETKKFLLLR
jgi:photosystem II stability/assembly factor-like uncharacterized protein